MVGSRYIDWTHVRVEGEREAAAPYVGEARKLLGAVMEQAKVNDLGVHSLTRQLADGTVLIAEKHGDIPRITIVPPPPSRPVLPGVLPEDFVVWARDTDQPAGIDATYPQQILRPSWRSYFFNSDIAGHDAFPSDKGTYGGALPAGLRFAGNVDWANAEEERFSWYGPSSRYWYDGYRQPEAQYGRHVFHLGQVLLDVDQYCIDSDVDFDERYILGAAKVGLSLYVMHAALEPVTYTVPPSATQAPDGYASPAYPTGAVALVLRRYGLTIDTVTTDPMRYRVASGSHEDLWSDAVVGGAAPWTFNVTGDAAVTHLTPLLHAMFQQGEVFHRPSATHTRIELSIDDEGVTRQDSAVSLAAGLGAVAVIAEDGDRQLLLRRITAAAEPAFDQLLTYEMDGQEYVAFRVTSSNWAERFIAWADLREGVLLLLERAVEPNPTGATSDLDILRFLVCAGGVETVVYEAIFPFNGPTTPAFCVIARYVLNRCAEAAMSPLGALYVHFLGVVPGSGTTADGNIGLLHARAGRAFRSADVFGGGRAAPLIGAWLASINYQVPAADSPPRTQTDFLGHTTTPGYATADGITAVSACTGVFSGPTELMVHDITGGDLGALTGVDGSASRYHPIWLLGKSPTQTA